MNIFKRKLSDEKFAETIQLLKGLDKIKAPDNFEYNLMVKIENREFGNIRSEKTTRRLVWILPPVAALSLTAIVLFFMFGEQPSEFDNPLLSPPLLRTEFQSSSVEKTRGPVEYVAKETNTSLESAEQGYTNSAYVGYQADEDNANYRVVLQPNDVVVREKVDFPFDNANNVNLDNYIDGSGENHSANSSAQLVRDGYPVYDFNGFVVREKIDRKTMEKYRSRMDSLKNVPIQK